jgi:hypothetical protein
MAVSLVSSGTASTIGRYPKVNRDHAGHEIMPVSGEGAWASGACVKSPDQRYRSPAVAAVASIRIVTMAGNQAPRQLDELAFRE